MEIIMFILAIGGVAVAAFFFKEAKSAVHEIEALMCLLGSAVLFSGAAIVEAIRQIKRFTDRFQVEDTKKGQSNEKS